MNNEIQKALLPGQNPDGKTILAVIIKRSYTFEHDGVCQRADKDTPIHTADIPYADPMNSTIEFEADFVAYKSATDVVLNGFAYPERNKSSTETTCSLYINNQGKYVKVFGERYAEVSKKYEVSFSKPKSFERLFLQYENAYGGIDIYTNSEIPFPYPRNIMGKGFLVKPEKKIKIELPNIETPDFLLTPNNLITNSMENWEKQPLPASFGWVSKGWKPRCDYGGVMPGDKAFEEELYTLFTKDIASHDKEIIDSTRLPTMDFRFFNGASNGLVLPFLNGDEVIRTNNFSPEGVCDFELPSDKPTISLQLNSKSFSPEAKLYTVMILMEKKQVDLTWCGIVECPSLDWIVSLDSMNLDIQ